jgi:hypothetical protein
LFYPKKDPGNIHHGVFLVIDFQVATMSIIEPPEEIKFKPLYINTEVSPLLSKVRNFLTIRWKQSYIKNEM